MLPRKWSKGDHTEALTYCEMRARPDAPVVGFVSFQDGPVKEHGANGAQNEDIIEMLLDRLHSLNEMEDGKYACRENSLAITKLEEALFWLRRRTENRVERGVEGTNTP